MKVNVIVYMSGKVVIVGKGMEDFVCDMIEFEVIGVLKLGYDEVNYLDWFELYVGFDESGKGDFFGLVMMVIVIVDCGVVEVWFVVGVKDLKKIFEG